MFHVAAKRNKKERRKNKGTKGPNWMKVHAYFVYTLYFILLKTLIRIFYAPYEAERQSTYN